MELTIVAVADHPGKMDEAMIEQVAVSELPDSYVEL